MKVEENGPVTFLKENSLPVLKTVLDGKLEGKSTHGKPRNQLHKTKQKIYQNDKHGELQTI